MNCKHLLFFFLSGAIMSSAAAEDHSVKELRDAGFAPIALHVWERVNHEGVTERVGSGPGSYAVILDRLQEVEAALEMEASKSTNVPDLLMIGGALDYVRGTIDTFTSSLKSTGDNGCTTGTQPPSASVSVGSRNASAGIGGGGFGPYPSNSLVRLALALAYPATGGGSSIDINANLGTPISGAISVSATGSASSTCRLYAFGVNYSFVSTCLRWADAAYAGSC